MFPTRQTAVLTAHFGDPVRVELLARRLQSAFPEIARERVFVIDQDRTESSAELLRRLLGPVQVLRYPISEPHVAATGHDHGHSLNLAVRAIEADFLMLFDSDAHPVGASARQLLATLIGENDAVLAADAADGRQSHPSFMLFGPAVDRGKLFFDADQLDLGTDTGREIFGQVERMELRATLLRPTRAFGGRWGTFYLGGSIYHHGQGSFESSRDARLRKQAESRRGRGERFFREHVLRGEYALSRREALALRLSGRRA